MTTQQQKKEQYIEFLECLSDKPLPERIDGFSEDSLADVCSLVENIVEQERAGLDKFFGSMSQTLKYIPNFLVLAITNKYIEPPVAARITMKLPLKQAISIAKGLSAEYIGQTAVYMDDEYAALLLASLPKKNVVKIANILFEKHPLKALDILAFAKPSFFDLLKPPPNFVNMSTAHLSDARCATLGRF